MNTQQEPVQPPGRENFIGGILGAFSPAQAIADLVDVTRTARKAGILFPMFLTPAAFNVCVAVPEGVAGQDEAGRLWEVVRMTRLAILRRHFQSALNASLPLRLTMGLYVRNDNHTVRLIKLIAVCAAPAMDDPPLAITVMTVDEAPPDPTHHRGD